jgi:hypothetical protein
MVLSERHLKRLLQQYVDYYHSWRTHLSLAMDCLLSRPIHLPEQGRLGHHNWS